MTQQILEELRQIQDLLDVDVQNQFAWKACEREQGRFDKKTIKLVYGSIQRRKESGCYTRCGKHWKRRRATPNSINFWDAIELSPRRRALPRAQARLLDLAEQNGAPNNSVDCVWAKIGNHDFLQRSGGDRSVPWPLVM